ncbi:FecCD family ABC transporter permease [Falsibacillus pallidus]|uniref:FecCD family ABC transporter permease n=1 Tax=Falsibacillus pallidus TaxID=493781 RepID=UPI003D97A163
MKKYKNLRLGKGAISYLIEVKSLTKIGILAIIAVLLFIISTCLGDMNISPWTVLKVFFGGGEYLDRLIVIDFRLPRIIVSLIVGMALAAAGAILQGMIRNPLASPDVIGISGGASTAVVAFLAIFSDANNALTVSVEWLPVAAFLGSTFVAFLVYVLAWRNGISPIRLVLIGIGISTLMQAFTTLLMILGPIYQASQANIWITGTVNGSTWKNVWIVLPWTVVLLIFAFVAARNISIQELGEDIAVGAGSTIQKNRLLLLMLTTGLVGGAVAFAGGIGFVGLMAPHMARRLVGSSFGVLLAASAFIGGILVMIADLIGRTLFIPLEVPAGVFTAAIGAPYFIYLLFRTKNA